jgi:polyisoprenoid-binding protein YceI
MKYLIVIIVIGIIITAGIFLTKGGNEETGKETSLSDRGIMSESASDGMYGVVAEESVINWEGRKPRGANYRDRGTISVSSGNFTVSGDEVTDGNVVIDMNSITVLSTGLGTGESMLQNHLKTDDFFSVEEFPTAELKVTSAVLGEDGFYKVRGTLTIKGITNDVEFPAVVSTEGDSIEIEGETQLDRTLWDVRFGSGKFFSDLTDNLVDDFFTVSFSVTARRAQ